MIAMTENVKHVDVLLEKWRVRYNELIQMDRTYEAEQVIRCINDFKGLQREAAGDGATLGCDLTLSGLIIYGRIAANPAQGATPAHLRDLVRQMLPHLERFGEFATAPASAEPPRGEATGDTPTFADAWARLTPRDRAIISAYFMEQSRRPDARGGGEAERVSADEVIKQLKLRIHFINYPGESMWNAGTPGLQDHWIPDWRYEIALIENYLHGSPITAAKKPGDTKRRIEVSHPTPAALDAERLDWLSQSHNIKNETVLNGYGNLRDRIDAARATTGADHG
jgi:hypothetical protein